MECPDKVKVVDLHVEFIAGRATERPVALWNPATRSIWIRGLYRRSEQHSTSIRLRVKPVPRMVDPGVIRAEAQTQTRAVCHKEISLSGAEPCGKEEIVEPTDMTKLAWVAETRIRQDGSDSIHETSKVIGGDRVVPCSYDIEYERSSAEPGSIQLGAAFFSKNELMGPSSSSSSDDDTDASYHGRYELQCTGHTQCWTPEIRLVLPPSYSRYIEREGEAKVIFIRSLVYRADIGAWFVRPCTLSASRQYLANAMEKSAAADFVNDLLEVQEPMITKSVYGYTNFIHQAFLDRKKKAHEQSSLTASEESEGESTTPSSSPSKRSILRRGHIVPLESGSDISSRVVKKDPVDTAGEGKRKRGSTRDMENEIRILWGHVSTMEEEMKKSVESASIMNTQNQRILAVLNTLATGKGKKRRLSSSSFPRCESI